METVWYYDKNGNEAIPMIQLKEPIRVTDLQSYSSMRPRWIETRPNDQGALDWIEFSSWFDMTEEEFIGLSLQGASLSERIRLSSNSEIVINNGNFDLTLSVPEYGRSGDTATYRSNGFKISYQDVEQIASTNANDTFNAYGIRNLGLSPIFIRDYTGSVRLSGVRVPLTNYNNNNMTLVYSNIGGNIDSQGTRTNNFLSIPAEIWETFPNSKDSPIIKEEGIVNINNRFAPRTQTSGIGVYPLSRQQVELFTKDLWTTNLVEALNELVNGDPMNSIISLRWFYGIGNAIPRTQLETYVVLGNVPFNGFLSEEALITRPASSELMTYSMGDIEVPRHYNNFLDLAPFTKLQLYIPYVGFVDLNATEFMGKRLRLEYNINIVTGATVALVYVSTGENSWRTAAEYVTTMGVEIPLTVDAREHISTRIATTMAGAASAGIGMAAGSAMGPIGMAAGSAAGAQAGSMALSTFQNGFDSIANMPTGNKSRNGGGVDNETGSLGDFTPYIILTRPQAIAPPEYNDIIGRPDHRKVRIGEMSGFLKVGAFESSNYTTGLAAEGIQREAMNEIEGILKAGVYTT